MVLRSARMIFPPVPPKPIMRWFAFIWKSTPIEGKLAASYLYGHTRVRRSVGPGCPFRVAVSHAVFHAASLRNALGSAGPLRGWRFRIGAVQIGDGDLGIAEKVA